jgi:two-component system chemotaxis response regulator CheB
MKKKGPDPDPSRLGDPDVFANLKAVTPLDGKGTPSPFSCPDCSGVLWEQEYADALLFRCRVGHAYRGEVLFAAQDQSVEAALWVACRALEERAATGKRLADKTKDETKAAALRVEAAKLEGQALTIRQMVTRAS